MNPGQGDWSLSWLMSIGGTLFFSATDGTSGDELWSLDLA